MSRPRAAFLVASFVLAIALAAASPVSAQLAGTWSGSSTLAGHPGVLRLQIAGPFGSTAMIRADGRGFAASPNVGAIDGSTLTTTLRLDDGSTAELRGSAKGDLFSGTLTTPDGKSASIELLRARTTASPDLTGTWSGSTTLTFNCDYNNGTVVVPVSGTVNVTLALLQTNGAVAGTIEIDNVPDTDSTCHVIGTLPPLIGPVTGSVSGNSFSGTASVPGDKGPDALTFSGAVNGSSMTLAFGIGDGSLSPTLTQTSTQPPATTLTGTWTGTVTSTMVPCGTLPPITFTANITGTFLQAGPNFTGDLTVTGGKKDKLDSGKCSVVDNPLDAISVAGQISGNTLTGLAQDVSSNNKTVQPFTATLSGNTISGTVTPQTAGESDSFTLTRAATDVPAPAVISFAPDHSTIAAGGTARLSWATTNAVSVSIDNGVGIEGAFGSVAVSPKQTTTYTLTATGAGGTASASTTVTIAANGAQIVVSAMPAGMLQAVNGGASTDRFSLTNTGGLDANVSVSIGSSIFTVSPASTTIPAQSTAVFVVQAAPQPAGTYSSNVTVLANGAAQPVSIPLTLLVVAPPSGTVLPQPAAPRIDVGAPQGQNPTGSVNFTNEGTATLQAIAVSDAPWLIPQSGIITIAAGATQPVSFSIDRSKRPDGANVGGIAGKISLRYFSSGSSKGALTLGTTPANSVSVTIVDVVKPGTTAGGPPPLQPGELALWVDRLTSTSSTRAAGDLYFSSHGSLPSINDLKMYYGGSTSPSALTSAIPQFPPNSALSLPAVARNVFGATGAAPLQIRSSDAANLSLLGVHLTSTPDRKASFVGALPTLRSDRSLAPGQSAVISGLEISPTSTDAPTAGISVQEVSGNAGAVNFDFRDADGKSLGTDSTALPPFSLAGGPVPAGTASVIITNPSSSGARLAPFATIEDEVTDDEFAIVDPSQASGTASGTLVMPIVTSPVSGQTTTLYVTNTSNAALNAGVEVAAEGIRHRAVRFSAHTSAVQPAPLNPLQTSKITIPSKPGFVRITGPAGALTATGRVTVSGYGGIFGSTLPAVPISAAIGSGQLQRFAGVDDASDASIAAGTPATYRSSIILIETAGQPATVRVTLRYTFPAGSLVTAQASSSRDFTVSAGQMFEVTDLALSVIGPQRTSFGDLHNMLVDVSVVGGSGKVVPFVVAVDNGSGDLMVRAE